MADSANKILLVLTSFPDRDGALKLAQTLVEKRLAACVNVLDGCTSVYRWKETTQTEQEIPVLIKTRADRFERLQEEIRECHPYELPEIIAVPVEAGLAAYLNWVSVQVDSPE